MSNRFVNLTPHPVHLQMDTGLVLEVQPTGLARVEYEPGALISTAEHEDGGGIPVHALHSYGPVIGLPDEVAPGDLLVVSLMVLQAAAQEVVALETHCETDAPDVSARLSVLRALVAPGTGPHDGPVRNEKGHVVAVTRLIGLR